MRCVVANWKMNLIHKEMEAFCAAFMEACPPMDKVEVAIAPPFPHLYYVWEVLRSAGVRIFGQNGHFEPSGAYTGEVSMAQLRDVGCSGVILGHSERRQYFGETDELLAKKLRAARGSSLLPLLCIGETLSERESRQTISVLRRQLSILGEAGPGPLWVAYEPVWAIGTGLRADVNQIKEAHAFIREELTVALGSGGQRVPILYGGSVVPGTFPELLGVPEVAGALVGGASLDPQKFVTMVKAAQEL